MILIARGFLIEYGQKMIKTSQHIIETVEKLGIDTVYHEHDAVFTVEESKKIKDHIDGCGTKNLFLKNKKGVMVLVLAKHDTQVDLKGLSKRIGGGFILSNSSYSFWAAFLKSSDNSVITIPNPMFKNEERTNIYLENWNLVENK